MAGRGHTASLRAHLALPDLRSAAQGGRTISEEPGIPFPTYSYDSTAGQAAQQVAVDMTMTHAAVTISIQYGKGLGEG